MKCQHIDETNSGQAIHTLPCRDRLCMPCLFKISDLFKGNPFSCPLCGNYTQYVDAMIQSIIDEANPHRTKQIGQKKEEFTSSRIGEGTERDQRSDEASEYSDWYNTLSKGDPPSVHASDRSFATSYSPGGYSCNILPHSPSISTSQEHQHRPQRDHHGWSEHPNVPVTGTGAHHQSDHEFPIHNGDSTIQIQKEILAQCQQDKANSERDFHLSNRRDIPDNYCQSDKGQGTSKADVFCIEHDRSEVYFFCKTCSRPVCGKCVNSTHSEHKYFNFESPGETDSEKQSKIYHASLSDTSTDLSPSKINRNSDSRQGFHKSSNDEDYLLNMEGTDKQEQRKLLEQCKQATHTTHYDIPPRPPQTHGYNLRNRSTGARRYSETEVAQFDAVASKGEDRFCKDHPGSEVYFFCVTCDTPVCGKCITAEHGGHMYDKFDNSEEETTNEVVCAAHKLPCTMYCVDCNVMICLTCSKEFKHWRHETLSLDKDAIAEKFMKYSKTLERITEKCDKLKELSTKGKEKVQKEVDELKKKVTEETQLAKEEIDSIAAEQIAKIEDELERCMKPREDFDVEIANMEKELKDNKETIKTAWQLITDNDLPNAALAARSVDDSLQKITKVNPRISRASAGLGLQFQVNRIPRTKHYAPFFVYKPLY